MIITKTPLRISFVGGGTDLADYYATGYGAVVSAAISKYVYITINKRFDDTIRISYSKTEIVDDYQTIQHDIAREAMRLVGITKGIEITSIADVPAGTGLGSSSAFAVGILNALHTYAGDTVSAGQLAEEACKIEIDILGHPIGKQDQYASAYGGLNRFLFYPDGRVIRDRITLDEDGRRQMNEKLLVFYTGVSRSADEILSVQKKDTKVKIKSLDFLRDKAGELYSELLEKGFTAHFGLMLHEAWEKKKELAGAISNASINDWYDMAIEAGATGGKLLGAGGGGFLLFYCEREKQESLRKALPLKEMDISFSCYGSRVIYFG